MSVNIESSRKRAMKKLLDWGATAITMPINFATGMAVITFSYKGNFYSFKYSDKNGTEALSKLSWSLCRLIDCDIRDILPFSKTAHEFLTLPSGTINQGEAVSNTKEYLSPEIFEILDLTWEASNDELKKKYRKLATMFHPDRAINSKDKEIYESKMSELNEAYSKIKKVRGFQ